MFGVFCFSHAATLAVVAGLVVAGRGGGGFQLRGWSLGWLSLAMAEAASDSVRVTLVEFFVLRHLVQNAQIDPDGP